MFEHVLVIVLAAIVVFALVIGLACLRKKLVDEANEIGQWLSQHGFAHAAKLFSCAANHDWPGVIAEIKWFVRLIREPKQAALLLDGVVVKNLGPALSDASRAAPVAKEIVTFVTANPAAAAALGLAVVAPK